MKKRTYLTLTIFSLLIVLTVFFVIFPLFNRIKNNSEELVAKKENIIFLEARVSNLERFRALYAELEHFLEEVDNLFVDSEMPIEFIDFLERTSKESQLEIEILPISDKKTREGFWPYLTFQITSSGSFSNFLRFLEKLENNPYLIEVKNITISRLTKEGAAFSGVRANFSVEVFVKQPNF